MADSPSVTPASLDTRARYLGAFARQRVLVTGGGGFLGSNVAERLVQLGAEVVMLDDFSTGRREALPAGIKEILEGSVTDTHTVRKALEGCAFVFHLAARNIILSTSQVLDDYTVNIGGTLNLLLSARDMDPPPRVVYTSSASVYGNPRSLPICEDDSVNVLSPYAASKFAGESYCRAFFEMYALPVSVVRYSNVYGVNQSPTNPYCGVVSKLLDAVLSGRPMPVHGSGLQTRDFTYVTDAVEATLLAASVHRAEGEVFNVGSGFETSVLELARTIARIAGVDPEIEFIDRRDIDNVQRRVLNIEKTRRVLRWIPQTTLEQGLRDTFQWLTRQRPQHRSQLGPGHL